MFSEDHQVPFFVLGFPSWLKPLFQSEAKSETIEIKIIVHVTRKVLHLASFWKWEILELRILNRQLL